MKKRKSQYSKTIVAPARKIAGSNPVGGQSIGAEPPVIVPGSPRNKPRIGPPHRRGWR